MPDHLATEPAPTVIGHPAAEDAVALLSPIVDPENGVTLYPVRHALGGIGYSFNEESQRRWQALADRQAAWLRSRCAKTER